MGNLAVSNEKIAEHVTTLVLWLTDDIVFDFSVFGVHFSHSYKVCGNSIGI